MFAFVVDLDLDFTPAAFLVFGTETLSGTEGKDDGEGGRGERGDPRFPISFG